MSAAVAPVPPWAASERAFPATAMPDRDWWAALWPDPAGVLRSLGARPGLRSVDLCCGDGYFTAPLARLVAPAWVVGLDLDPTLLARARAELARAAPERAGTVLFVCADACDLSALLRRPVDYVLLANTFHGVPDPRRLAAATRRRLVPGGRLVIVNWYPLPRERTPVRGRPRGPRTELRMPPAAVRRIVEPAGFREVAVVPVGPYHYGSIFEASAAP